MLLLFKFTREASTRKANKQGFYAIQNNDVAQLHACATAQERTKPISSEVRNLVGLQNGSMYFYLPKNTFCGTRYLSHCHAI